MRMPKNKLVLMTEDEQRKRIKADVVKFIDDRWIWNKETVQVDIQSVFQKPPYNISDGTIRNLLDELVTEHKISTWKIGKNRYYGPLKLPISLKFGGIFAISLIAIVLVVDIFFNYKYVSIFSFLLYSLTMTTIFTAFAYRIEKKSN